MPTNKNVLSTFRWNLLPRWRSHMDKTTGGSLYMSIVILFSVDEMNIDHRENIKYHIISVVGLLI